MDYKPQTNQSQTFDIVGYIPSAKIIYKELLYGKIWYLYMRNYDKYIRIGVKSHKWEKIPKEMSDKQEFLNNLLDL